MRVTKTRPLVGLMNQRVHESAVGWTAVVMLCDNRVRQGYNSLEWEDFETLHKRSDVKNTL